MHNQFEKAINLVKKTGDRLIVFDSAKLDNVYVVMSLKDYENIVLGKSEVRGLTEDELLDKINRDIAIWKSDQEFIEDLNQFRQADKFTLDSLKDFDYDTSKGYSEEKEKKSGNIWSIPKEIKEGAEEVIEEDRQYLEEVRF